MASDKIYLSSSYGSKDKLKACGAQWDPKKSRWYITKSLSPLNFEKLIEVIRKSYGDIFLIRKFSRRYNDHGDPDMETAEEASRWEEPPPYHYQDRSGGAYILFSPEQLQELK